MPGRKDKKRHSQEEHHRQEELMVLPHRRQPLSPAPQSSPSGFKITHTPDRPQRTVDPVDAPSEEECGAEIAAWHRRAALAAELALDGRDSGNEGRELSGVWVGDEIRPGQVVEEEDGYSSSEYEDVSVHSLDEEEDEDEEGQNGIKEGEREARSGYTSSSTQTETIPRESEPWMPRSYSRPWSPASSHTPQPSLSTSLRSPSRTGYFSEGEESYNGEVGVAERVDVQRVYYGHNVTRQNGEGGRAGLPLSGTVYCSTCRAPAITSRGKALRSCCAKCGASFERASTKERNREKEKKDEEEEDGDFRSARAEWRLPARQAPHVAVMQTSVKSSERYDRLARLDPNLEVPPITARGPRRGLNNTTPQDNNRSQSDRTSTSVLSGTTGRGASGVRQPLSRFRPEIPPRRQGEYSKYGWRESQGWELDIVSSYEPNPLSKRRAG